MNDTPRTDEDVRLCKVISESFGPMVGADFARTLERELNEANKKLSKLVRLIDLSEAANNSQTEMEVAASATFNEALAVTNGQIIEEELNEAKLKIAELERELKEARK